MDDEVTQPVGTEGTAPEIDPETDENHLHGDMVHTPPLQLGNGLPDNIAEFYTMVPVRKQFNRKFQLTFENFECRVSRLHNLPMHLVFPCLVQILESILERIVRDVAPHDMVRIRLDSRHLQVPIWTSMIRRDQLTVDRWMIDIERVLNSNMTFRLDETFNLWVQHTNQPAGSCSDYVPHLLRTKLERLRCVTQVKNTDEICMARAIALGVAFSNGDKRGYDNMRKNAKNQDEAARQLIQRAGLPVRKYSIEDADAFQAALPDHQLIIVSVDHLNSVIYSGDLKPKSISILHHGNHFDFLNTIHRWFRANYFCFRCLKPYRRRDAHLCESRCKQCLRTSCARDTDSKIRCNDCHRDFSGQECFDAHKEMPERGRSICERFFICQQCRRFVSYSRVDRTHVCDEVYCQACNEYFTPEQEHCCYMQPVQLKDTDYDKHASTKCMYFDFETTKTDSGVFFPNLAVINVDGETKVFPDLAVEPIGRDISGDVCEFIFQKRFENYFVVAHNFKVKRAIKRICFIILSIYLK